jgi:hypothetical protein
MVKRKGGGKIGRVEEMDGRERMMVNRGKGKGA